MVEESCQVVKSKEFQSLELFLKNPQILLMDEATSSLDSVSEKMVQNAIEKLSKHRTTLVVAHRLNTIQKADLIVVMDNGKIIQTGTHKKLLSIKGNTNNLWKCKHFINKCE